MSADPRDYKLDLSTRPPPVAPAPAPQVPASARPFLSVHFACCGVYTRIYRSPDASTYRGRCPRCLRPVTFQVAASGTDSRFFVVH
jgi:hypothetical protein